jgi:predicted phage replisome organizer/uncharacterized phage protein (TIGR02220 family)
MMAEIKWIKINVGMFDDEKIKLIEKLPDADTILVIWLKLLAQAGKANAGGYVMLTENIPYTEEMLSDIFNRPLNTVRLALQTFRSFEMIEWDENGIEITNWGKHQNLDALERMREKGKKRVQEHRAKKALDAPKDEIPFKEIVDCLNSKAGKRYRSNVEKTKKCIRARWNDGFRVDDFKSVINKKAAQWNGTEMEKYLRPETLFGTKFEGYLNESGNAPARNDGTTDLDSWAND